MKRKVCGNSVCKENGSNVFRKEREQYHKIQDLKAQMQDKNIAISELKKLIEKCKGKFVETQFDKPSVVRQPNAQRIPKPSVLGKPTLFSNSPEMRSFQTKQSVNKTNVSDGMYRIATTTTQNREPQLPHASMNTNPHVSKSSRVNHTTSVSRPQLKYLNDVNARTKKPKAVPISAGKPKRKANKFVATPHKKPVASDTTIQKSKSYYKELYENTNQE
ncbi:hypothetical protein Tco_1497221 [Tanacetum coccineum]